MMGLNDEPEKGRNFTCLAKYKVNVLAIKYLFPAFRGSTGWLGFLPAPRQQWWVAAYYMATVLL